MTQKPDLKKLSNCDENGIFRPEKLALVHVTSYMPQKAGDHYEIQSTGEATDYIYPRNTIHFTIGHHVDGVFGGNWDDKGIMVVASLKDTIDANDKPLGMSSFDTYFETTPGHNLQLPEGTHFFIPTTDPEKLGGKLTQTKGNITYYKSGNYTDEEKDQIFREACYRKDWYTSEMSLSMHIDGQFVDVDEEHYRKLPDPVCMFDFKKNLLADYLERSGYIKNRELDGFNREGSEYANGVAELGKKLGCRFCTAGNKGHFFSDFTSEPIVRDLFSFMHYSDFILHPDEFDIISAKTFYKSRQYTFRRKNGKGIPITVWGSQSREEESFVKMLKETPDFTEEMNENKNENGSKWSPAFRETYDVWMKKTSERLKRFYGEAKDYPFDKALATIQGKMKEFDILKGGLLTSSFAKGARTPERAEKAQRLLDIMRERGKRKMTVKEYMEKFVDIDGHAP